MYIFLCNSCFAGDSNFNGFGLVSHRAFPKSMITGLYASPCLSVSIIIGLQVVVQEANFMDSGECFSDAFHNIEPATLAQRELPNGFFVCFVL